MPLPAALATSCAQQPLPAAWFPHHAGTINCGRGRRHRRRTAPTTSHPALRTCSRRTFPILVQWLERAVCTSQVLLAAAPGSRFCARHPAGAVNQLPAQLVIRVLVAAPVSQLCARRQHQGSSTATATRRSSCSPQHCALAGKQQQLQRRCMERSSCCCNGAARNFAGCSTCRPVVHTAPTADHPLLAAARHLPVWCSGAGACTVHLTGPSGCSTCQPVLRTAPEVRFPPPEQLRAQQLFTPALRARGKAAVAAAGWLTILLAAAPVSQFCTRSRQHGSCAATL